MINKKGHSEEKGRKLNHKEWKGEGRELKKERKRKRKIRKEYRKQLRIGAMVGRLKMNMEEWKIGRKAETPTETEQRMKEIDKMIEEIEEKEEHREKEEKGQEERMRLIGAIEKGEETISAVAMMQIQNKVVKTLVDTGACASMMAKNWVKHLGLYKMIDKTVKVPDDLKGVEGSRVKIIGSIRLEVQIDDAKFEWTVWVTRRQVVPLIIGTDILAGTSIVDMIDNIWIYKKKIVPIQLTRKKQNYGGALVIVADRKQKIPPHSMMLVVGKVMGGEEKQERKERTIDVTGLKWKGAHTETGITQTYIKTNKARLNEERVVLAIANENEEYLTVHSGDVIAMGEPNVKIIASVRNEPDIEKIMKEKGAMYRELIETSKTETAEEASQAPKLVEEDHGMKEGEEGERNITQKEGFDSGLPVVTTGTNAEDEKEGNERRSVKTHVTPIRTPRELAEDFFKRYEEEFPITRQYLKGGLDPEPSIGDRNIYIARSGAVLLEKNALDAEEEGEHCNRTDAARVEKAHSQPCDGLSESGVENNSIPTNVTEVQSLIAPVMKVASETQSEYFVRLKESLGDNEREKPNAVKLITEEDVDDMIRSAEMSAEERERLKKIIMDRREAFVHDLRPAGQALFNPHRIKLRAEESIVKKKDQMMRKKKKE